MPDDRASEERDEREFEEFVAATLKVDPKGLSGKHRREVNEDETGSADEG